MAPDEYYRVHDESSVTSFDDDGFVAGKPQLPLRMFPDGPSEIQELSNALDKHLDWSNNTASPFISVYADYATALNSANARANQGRRGVIIARINVSESGERMWYRNVRAAAGFLKLRIELQAWRNSQYEYIFLHRIPREAVVEIIPVSWVSPIHRTLTESADH